MTLFPPRHAFPRWKRSRNRCPCRAINCPEGYPLISLLRELAWGPAGRVCEPPWSLRTRVLPDIPPACGLRWRLQPPRAVAQERPRALCEAMFATTRLWHGSSQSPFHRCDGRSCARTFLAVGMRLFTGSAALHRSSKSADFHQATGRRVCKDTAGPDDPLGWT